MAQQRSKPEGTGATPDSPKRTGTRWCAWAGTTQTPMPNGSRGRVAGATVCPRRAEGTRRGPVKAGPIVFGDSEGTDPSSPMYTTVPPSSNSTGLLFSRPAMMGRFIPLRLAVTGPIGSGYTTRMGMSGNGQKNVITTATLARRRMGRRGPLATASSAAGAVPGRASRGAFVPPTATVTVPTGRLTTWAFASSRTASHLNFMLLPFGFAGPSGRARALKMAYE